MYRNALSIVALSAGNARPIRGIAPERTVHLIPNFFDLDVFYPKEKDEQKVLDYGLQKPFTIAYTGALERVNAVDELVLLTDLAQHRKKLAVCLHGRRQSRANLKGSG